MRQSEIASNMLDERDPCTIRLTNSRFASFPIFFIPSPDTLQQGPPPPQGRIFNGSTDRVFASHISTSC